VATALAVNGQSGETAHAATNVRAFPGAEGFGTGTSGGRGGEVIAVTNLEDSGPGSFRAAVERSGPRTVIFKVSGTIRLRSRIDVTEPELTVAGQTAPGGGITLRMDPSAEECVDKGAMKIETRDVVIRYLRFRPGATPCADDSHDGLVIYEEGTQNVVIDHSSISWAVDENLNTYDDSRNITVSNSIISEALSESTHPEGEHSKGMLAGGEGAHNISIHHNLFVSNVDRNPQISGVSVADIRNNVVYNHADGSGDGATLISSSKGEPEVNWIANYYKSGPDSPGDRTEFDTYEGSTGSTHAWFGEGNRRWTADGDKPARVSEEARSSRVGQPFDAAPVTTTGAVQAYTDVLADAGASYPHRDAVDARVVEDVRNGTGGVIDHPSEVGGYPDLPREPAPADSDGDGMPDAFEHQHGTDPRQADANGDEDGDGYTNIEDWFNGLVAGSGPPASPTPSPTPSPGPSPTASPSAPVEPQLELVCPEVPNPRDGQRVTCVYKPVSSG
jgi:pectate lyase